ncbi:MAG: hypothetical protein WCB57_03375 [Pseudonocardiaceae bacterium]
MQTIIDSVGRIVVPKPLRDALGLRAGSAVDISRYGAGLQLVPTGRTARLVEGPACWSPPGHDDLLTERFGAPLLPGPEVAGHLPDMLSKLGIAGGAVYDAHVALAAAEHNAELATRDARAKTTYEICGVEVLIVG